MIVSRKPMRWTALTLATIWLACIGAASLGTGSVRAASATHCVNTDGSAGCSTSIQAAIDAANPGDTISIAAGTYNETVSITKALMLQGAGAATTIIDATGLANGVVVQGTTDPVRIAGLTVENAMREGIVVGDSAQVTVTDNVVAMNDTSLQPPTKPGAMPTCPGADPLDGADCGEGLHLRGVSDSFISNNLIQGNQGGILITDETGPSHDNWIVDNTVQNNARDCGITLASHPGSSSTPSSPAPGFGIFNNTVEGNISTGNGAAGVGIFTPTPGTAAYDNLVIGNTLTNNGTGGVTLHSHAPGQDLDGNMVLDNTISGNGADPGQTTDTTGIIIFSDAKSGAAPIAGMLIAHNRISEEAIGIYIGTTAIDQSIHFNDLAATGVGVDNEGTGSVDAAWNYWGCAGGPGSSGCAAMKGTVSADAPLPQAPGAGR